MSRRTFLFILKFLFLDQILKLRWHMKALLSVFQKRYRDPSCCTNWQCGKQKHGYRSPAAKSACAEVGRVARRISVLEGPKVPLVKSRLKLISYIWFLLLRDCRRFGSDRSRGSKIGTVPQLEPRFYNIGTAVPKSWKSARICPFWPKLFSQKWVEPSQIRFGSLSITPARMFLLTLFA